ncbi:hypothetical protein [Chitinivorax sp. B]|uniref:hypothetical protein n=1 Tax=Chitinivorax sp. B TaxID=2502235 RepID=UPI0010F731C0|nr:hypothetical protein [Chitinivorax sp. B]
MPKKTHAEYLQQQHPGITELAEYYAELGFNQPILWAKSELDGEPAVATAALIHALRNEIVQAEDHGWSAAIRNGDVNIEDETLIAEATITLDYLQERDVDLNRLTPLIRAIQMQTIRNVTTLLDDGPEICCIPLPAGRECGWQLTALDANGEPNGTITGLHEVIDDEEDL